MVSYKLGVFEKDDGRIIDLDKIVKLKGLENLDEFTSAFNNEEELRIYLFNQNLVTGKELKQKISIMYKYNGKVKKLPLIFSDIKKYLDVTNLRYNLKGLCGNIDFLEKLARHYSIGNDKYNQQGLNVQDIRIYLSDVRKNNGETFYSKILEVAIDDLFKKAVFKDVNKDTGEIQINYRGLRDLAIFIYKFKKDLELKEKLSKNEEWIQTELDLTEQETMKTTLDNEVEYEFDNDLEDEPEFPPNSEEEKKYQKYLDRLTEITFQEPIEDHDHYRR